MISLDTETTGLDFRHGARPYLVTTCTQDGTQHWWEWAVDPLTREVKVPRGDLLEIAEYLFADGPNGPIGGDGDDGGLILQNCKFDFSALHALGFWDLGYSLGAVWPDVRDTLLAGHLLASNHPHDLTSMATVYLGVDIEPYEKALEDAVKACRRMVQQAKLARKRHLNPPLRATRAKSTGKAATATAPAFEPSPLADWAIAEEGRPDMPSMDQKAWKLDGWLPRAVAMHLGYAHPREGCDHVWLNNECHNCRGHRYWVALRDYANADSAVTVALWQAQRREIARRGLGAIYQERLRILPVAYKIEQYGVTCNGDRMTEIMDEYLAESQRCEAVCLNIARGYGYALELPAGAVNNSLRTFCFDVLKLPPILNPKAKTEAPTLNKEAMKEYGATLPANSPASLFVRSLLGKRKRDTAIAFMNAYERFWHPWVPAGDVHPDTGAGWYRLHPSLNPTGTDTLRWSSSNPNEQNISKQEALCRKCEGKPGDKDRCVYCGGTGQEFYSLREVFGPAPGREWWSMDARGIEDRLPAYKSGQQELIAIFENPDAPPYYGSNHFLRFHTVYPDLWDAAVRQVGPDKAGPYIKKAYASTWYQWVKNGGFAVQYGAIDKPDADPNRPETWGTADRAFHKFGAHALLKVRFSKLEALNQWCIAFANRHGYIETMPRKSVDPTRGYPLLCARSEWGKILATVPLNYYIQGTACDWMQGAMHRCQDRLDHWRDREGFDGHIVMQVHDELVFDFPKGAHPRGPDAANGNLWRVKVLQHLMELGGDDIGIPTPTSCEYHEHSWARGASV